MTKILQLVDSVEYIYSNCFQHQLSFALSNVSSEVTMLSINELSKGETLEDDYDVVVSTLKQRTLLRERLNVAKFLRGKSLVVYDQDPWEAFKDGGEFKGSYKEIINDIDVEILALTSKWWTNYAMTQGLPAKFVKMWVLPEYCSVGTKKDIDLGFIGTLHPYRKKLVDWLNEKNKPCSVLQGGKSYDQFLRTLDRIKIFVHNEDIPIIIDGKPANIGTGLWVKDIEAAARGCFSIRNRLESGEEYIKNIPSIRLFDSFEEAFDIINEIENLDPLESQEIINTSVEYIKNTNVWNDTARALIKL